MRELEAINRGAVSRRTIIRAGLSVPAATWAIRVVPPFGVAVAAEPAALALDVSAEDFESAIELRIRYRGALPALLEERRDLTAEVLKVYVRRGTWSMPPFRPTEITDAEIEDIAAYLAESSR